TGDASLTDASALTISGADVAGTLTLVDTGAIGQSGAVAAGTLNANGSSITLTNSGNAIGTANLVATGDAALTDASALTISGADVGGNLTLLTKGNLNFVSSIQLINGTILAVAGWDGVTTDPTSLTSSSTYGQNGGSIIIGGNGASSDVAVGSMNGTATLLSDNFLLAAVNGYAQLGFHGGGAGAIDVETTGNITLIGGSHTAYFSQIGDGGYQVAGSNNNAITLSAAGNVTLSGGSGQESYAQIGNGGAESNINSHGYVNTGSITVSGRKVILSAGGGAGSYAQIGNGGFESGQSLSGTATIGGDIAVNAVNAVTLTGGGTSAYAQIGNAGDYTNYGAADGSGGTMSGDIAVVVSTPIGGIDPIVLTAGGGAQSYVQIGNGGDFENVPATGANVSFAVSGNVSVADITIIGSDTGANSYGQIGNGDAAGTGAGNVTGDIIISAGTNFTIVDGTAPGSSATIANDTGVGTSSGSVTGYTAPSSNPLSDPGTAGSVANLVQASFVPGSTSNSVSSIPSFSPQVDAVHVDVSTTAALPDPIEQLAGGSSENSTSTDDAVEIAIDGLFKHKAPSATRTIIPGLLKQVFETKSQAIVGVPPADADYSSWGNEALWRW
ncbi:MAG: hypothetical protein RB191_10825, partial [Terriglobia bacterium]|nr:hypothetical protein [Terriglobia bacterium]